MSDFHDQIMHWLSTAEVSDRIGALCDVERGRNELIKRASAGLIKSKAKRLIAVLMSDNGYELDRRIKNDEVVRPSFYEAAQTNVFYAD